MTLTTSPCSCELCHAAAKLCEQPEIAAILAEVDALVPGGRLQAPVTSSTVYPAVPADLVDPLQQADERLRLLVGRASSRADVIRAYGTSRAVLLLEAVVRDIGNNIDELQSHPWFLALTMPGPCEYAAAAKAEAERFDPYLVTGELEDGEIPF